MNIVWVTLFVLLVLALVRRHGWEYVPPVVLIAFGRWFASDLGIGQFADLVMLGVLGMVWMISARTPDEATPSGSASQGHLLNGTTLCWVIPLLGGLMFLMAPHVPGGRMTGGATGAPASGRHRVQGEIIPSTTNGPTSRVRAAHPVLPDAPTTMTPRRATGEGHTADAVDGPCEQRQPDEREPDSERAADDPCVSPAQPAGE